VRSECWECYSMIVRKQAAGLILPAYADTLFGWCDFGVEECSHGFRSTRFVLKSLYYATLHWLRRLLKFLLRSAFNYFTIRYDFSIWFWFLHFLVSWFILYFRIWFSLSDLVVLSTICLGLLFPGVCSSACSVLGDDLVVEFWNEWCCNLFLFYFKINTMRLENNFIQIHKLSEMSGVTICSFFILKIKIIL
jgi:hypothetical protein